jgi:CheY-like chemotaxis protein
MSEPHATGDARHSILVVEDGATMIEMLQILLEDSGYRILTAGRGDLALDLAREHTPDLITLDLGLPGMDGQEVLRLLRADPLTSNVPVIVMTGKAVALSAENVVAVLTKPFDVAQLEEIVGRVLGLAN